MATNSIDSHRKRNRSPSADDSKHRRRHRSNQHDAKKHVIDTEIESDVGIVSKLADYDMEEGEIVDNKVDSGEFHDRYMGGNASVENSGRMSSEILELVRSDRNCDDRDDRINDRLDESLELEIMTNVDSRKRSNEGDRAHRRSKAPSKSSTKDKEQHGVERNSYSDKIKDGREVGANDKLRKRSSSHHTSSKDYSNGKRDKLMYKDRRDRRGEDHERRRESGRDLDWDREHKKANDRGRSRDRNYATISPYRDMNVDREKYGESERDRARDSYRRRGRHDDEPDRSTRYHKYDDQDDGHGGKDLHHGYGKLEYINDRTRNYKSEKNQASKDVYVQEIEEANRDDDDQKEYQERVELKLAEQEEDDIDRIKEESRKIREAILQKYKVKQSQQLVVLQEAKDESDEQLKENSSQESSLTNAIQEKTCEIKNGKEAFEAAKLFNVEKSPLRKETAAAESSMGAVGLGEGSPKSERANDMFCDDIFGDSPAGIRKTGKRDGSNIEGSGLRDNWDDPEGYYGFRYGEVLDSRYEVIAAHGKGVFSTVVRAKDLKAGGSDPEEVAIKIIRNNEIMLKAGTEELVILKKLVDADPGDKRHCVRYLSHFKYRNHLCIVFESLHMNLREVLKKFGRNIGLKLTAVRAYAKQLIIALKHLTNCGVLHCDIKPDNMLVNDAKILLKLCDFGNAMLAGKNEITPYLVSRFYRAPEIILGLPYDHPVDMWSVGCCLYELYAGKVLFPGATNNDMLRLHMELKGSFPKKMLRKGAFIEPHFDQDLNFLATDEDPVTKKATRRLICNIRPKDIGIIVKGSGGEDLKMLANFKDLLDKIFILDPDKRLSVSQALNHPFIAGK